MNVQTNSMTTADAPARPVELQLIDIYDAACSAGDLATALEMAMSDVLDIRQRNAMVTLCSVLQDRFNDLKGMIEQARGEPA